MPPRGMGSMSPWSPMSAPHASSTLRNWGGSGSQSIMSPMMSMMGMGMFPMAQMMAQQFSPSPSPGLTVTIITGDKVLTVPVPSTVKIEAPDIDKPEESEEIQEPDPPSPSMFSVPTPEADTDETIPEETFTEETVPEETITEETFPEETVSEDPDVFPTPPPPPIDEGIFGNPLGEDPTSPPEDITATGDTETALTDESLRSMR